MTVDKRPVLLVGTQAGPPSPALRETCCSSGVRPESGAFTFTQSDETAGIRTPTTPFPVLLGKTRVESLPPPPLSLLLRQR